MLTRRIRRFLVTLSIGITACIVGMLYHRFINRPLSFISRSPSRSAVALMSNIPKKPVIVVGSGLAGLSAAHEALKAGASVHMLDRAPKPGGNSIKASSGINGAGTRFQKASGIESDDSFYDDTIRSAGARFRAWSTAAKPGIDRQTLIQVLIKQSEGAINWLVDEIGVDLSVVAPLGGHSVARTHRGSGTTPPGASIVTALLKQLGENPDFQLSNLADVTSLDLTDGRVSGVRYIHDGHPHLLEGPVVFAAGGFAGDANGLLAQYRPDLAGLPSTNEARSGSHGLLTDVGSVLVDMDSVQIHPTGFINPNDPVAGYKFLAAEVLRGEGGILLSPKGERLVNEMETREVVSKAVMGLPSRDDGTIKQWEVTLLLDPGAYEAAASHMGFYLFKGLMQKKKVRDLSPAMIAAVDKYAAAVSGGKDQEFGRRSFGHWRMKPGESNRDEEVYVGEVTPIVHFTMGGAAFNEKAQVLTSKGDALVPIGGLFAAGEITGGIHGDNRLGGSSLLECAVFGRIAGQEAARET